MKKIGLFVGVIMSFALVSCYNPKDDMGKYLGGSQNAKGLDNPSSLPNLQTSAPCVNVQKYGSNFIRQDMVGKDGGNYMYMPQNSQEAIFVTPYIKGIKDSADPQKNNMVLTNDNRYIFYDENASIKLEICVFQGFFSGKFSPKQISAKYPMCDFESMQKNYSQSTTKLSSSVNSAFPMFFAKIKHQGNERIECLLDGTAHSLNIFYTKFQR